MTRAKRKKPNKCDICGGPVPEGEAVCTPCHEDALDPDLPIYPVPADDADDDDEPDIPF